MSGLRNVILKIVPRSWAEDMEAESRRWLVKCDNCGFEQSYWDMGGLRWKASSSGK